MIISFIPVRCGSESIRFKNIKDFCGKPLVYWAIAALQHSKYVDKIVVATDCDEIKKVVQGFFFDKVIIYDRDKSNAEATSTTESVMLEFILKSQFSDSDIFLLVQATSPLTQTKDIDKAIEKYENEKADSLMSCVKTKRFFWNIDGTPLNYDYKNRPRRQEFEGLFMENGAFYLNTIANIKRDKNRLGGKISIYQMEDFTAIELDEEDDWLLAEKLMYKHILF